MKTAAKVDYLCDWSSKNRDDQRGHIKVTTATGEIYATWSCTGGMGDGAELVSNTTEEFTDEEADELVNATELCQGNGSYTAHITQDKYGWYTPVDVVWGG